MFEEARNDMNKQQEENMIENFGNINNEENNGKEQIELDEEKVKKFEFDKDKDKNKEKYSNLDKALFINNGCDDDDINFD